MRFHRYSETVFLVAMLSMFAGCGDISLNGTSTDFLQASSVSSGDFHNCAVSEGDVKCWGRGSSGQLGNDLTDDAFTPVLVLNLTGTALQAAAGAKHSCARLDNGEVWCWGDNSDGQLGNSTFKGSRVPVRVTGISTAAAITSGGNHSCALLNDGTVWCWGNNVHGQLGNNSTNDSSAPVQVTGLSLAVSAVSAGGTHTCAILSDGTVRCWGSNALEQLGNSSLFLGSNSRVPVEVTGLTGAQTIVSGANHSCAKVTTTSDTVRCWGNNASGQLGSAWTLSGFSTFETTSNAPLVVNGITTPLGSISAGSDHSCAVRTSGTVNCWGENGAGQLGNGGLVAGFVPPGAGASASSTVIPVSANSINSATQVSSGQFHTCALLSSGRVMCWGLNLFGQLGDGTTISASSPVQVTDTLAASVR